MNVIFICTGNTCRSPMAEALLRRKTDAHTVSSAGLSVSFAAPAAGNAAAVMAEYGCDVSAHRSRQLTAEMVENADLLLTMTDTHRDILCALFPGARDKTYSLGEYAGHSGQNVADPFGGDMETYRACAAEIAALIGESAL